MAATSARTLRLLSLMQTHRHWSGEELADRLAVSLRTLRRDIDRLRELGYPVHADRGVGGGYQLAAGASLPPLALDDEEAVAIAVGLQSAAQGPIAGTAEASVRALAKLVQVMPRRLRNKVEAVRTATVASPWGGSGPEIDPAVLVLVAQACRDHERITFGYTAADGAESSRRVEPHDLVSLGRRWYVVCHDLDRHDWRSFRLDRITALAPTGLRFAPRAVPGGDPAEFVRAGIKGATGGLRVVAEVAGEADDVRARIGRWSEVTAIGRGRCRVVMEADSEEWPILALGVAGADVLDVQPPEVADALRDWSRRFALAGA